jgi:hypothetical protein
VPSTAHPAAEWPACCASSHTQAAKEREQALTPIAYRRARLAGLLCLASCASGQKTAGYTSSVEGYVYCLPLDEVLQETQALLVQKGWHVERSGDELGTGWRMDASGTALGYRVVGERIDDKHCSIRIERLAAASGGASPRSSPITDAVGISADEEDVRLTPGLGTGRDGMDAPTTLGNAPPGLLVVPRGEDEALEWAVLKRLDPRAAQALQSGQARSVAAASATGAATAVQPQAVAPLPPAAACEPVTGVDTPIAERRLVLLGDVPGTNEIPDFVARLVCTAALKGIPTVVALELQRVDQAPLDTFLHSRGTASDRAAFLRAARSFDSAVADGHGSEAVLKLLERLRALRDAPLSVHVLAFNEAVSVPAREKARASTLERERRLVPEALVLVVLQRSQARTVLGPGEAPERAPLGWYLSRWGLRPLALDVHSPGGQTWACFAAGCGPVAVVPKAEAPSVAGPSHSVDFYPSPDAQGFQGAYSVETLTASSPAKP